MSDKFGQRPLIIVGFITLFLALIVIVYFSASYGIYGLAIGILTPVLNGWTIDLSLPDQRGKAISTMYIALEVGIGFGALFSGWCYQNVVSNLPNFFYFCAFMALIGLVFMVFKSSRKSKSV